MDPLVIPADALVVAMDGGQVCLCNLPRSPTLFIVCVTPRGGSRVSAQSVLSLMKEVGRWL